jgi:uncharacterized protein (TIGR03435 family)
MMRTPQILVVLGALASAQTPAVRPEFEVASIKPAVEGSRVMLFPPVGDKFTATNVSLKMLIVLAYRVRGFQIPEGPGWIGSDRYDVTAKAPGGLDLSADHGDRFVAMLQALLEERFQLSVHRDTRQMPVYALLPVKGGLKLPDADPAGCATFGLSSPVALAPCGSMMVTPNGIENKKISMPLFTGILSNMLGRPVIDKTGYTGTFGVHLEFASEGTAEPPSDPANPLANPDTSRPSIFTALQQQLGLRLEAQKGPGEILVIDHAERAPTEN